MVDMLIAPYLARMAFNLYSFNLVSSVASIRMIPLEGVRCPSSLLIGDSSLLVPSGQQLSQVEASCSARRRSQEHSDDREGKLWLHIGRPY